MEIKMYLHVGKGKSVREEKIIGIFDLDTATVSKISKKFISEKEKRGKIKYEDTDLPRAFILLGDREENEIILSRISPSGLKQRTDVGSNRGDI